MFRRRRRDCEGEICILASPASSPTGHRLVTINKLKPRQFIESIPKQNLYLSVRVRNVSETSPYFWTHPVHSRQHRDDHQPAASTHLTQSTVLVSYLADNHRDHLKMTIATASAQSLRKAAIRKNMEGMTVVSERNALDACYAVSAGCGRKPRTCLFPVLVIISKPARRTPPLALAAVPPPPAQHFIYTRPSGPYARAPLKRRPLGTVRPAHLRVPVTFPDRYKFSDSGDTFDVIAAMGNAPRLWFIPLPTLLQKPLPHRAFPIIQAKIIGAVSEPDSADIVATPIRKAFSRNGLGSWAPRRMPVLVCSRQFHSRDAHVNRSGASRSCQDPDIDMFSAFCGINGDC